MHKSLEVKQYLVKANPSASLVLGTSHKLLFQVKRQPPRFRGLAMNYSFKLTPSLSLVLGTSLCSANGPAPTESDKLYRKVKHRARAKVSSRQRPKRAPTKRRSPRRLRRRAPHTEHGLGVLSRNKPMCSLRVKRPFLCSGRGLCLYKIVFPFRALLWESIIHLLPSSTCKAYPIAILSHDHCLTCAPPSVLRF